VYYINYRKAPSSHELVNCPSRFFQCAYACSLRPCPFLLQPPGAVKVDKVTLPRNTEVQHLYQVQATEVEYQGMLLDLENRQNVEGIYEVHFKSHRLR
jgi:hypothetical protein